MKRSDLIEGLGQLGYPLIVPDDPISSKSVEKLLLEIADSDDPRLIEGFPVVLANCALKGIKIDFRRIMQNADRSGFKEPMEKLLSVSGDLMGSEGIDIPPGLDNAIREIEETTHKPIQDDRLHLRNGFSLSTERLAHTFERYVKQLHKKLESRLLESEEQHDAFRLHLNLSRLFSPKQKEVLLKKYNGELLTKTEREYYSRTIKKRLEAILSDDVRRIAGRLLFGSNCRCARQDVVDKTSLIGDG